MITGEAAAESDLDGNWHLDWTGLDGAVPVLGRSVRQPPREFEKITPVSDHDH